MPVASEINEMLTDLREANLYKNGHLYMYNSMC